MCLGSSLVLQAVARLLQLAHPGQVELPVAPVGAEVAAAGPAGLALVDQDAAADQDEDHFQEADP